MTFEAFNKIPRLFRNCTITEKIDGTNAQIFIHPAHPTSDTVEIPWLGTAGEWSIAVGSRKRWIGNTDDNFGFAGWVYDHLDEIVTLGPGRHFGEWWGQGIQRKYGLDHKRFSLFNVKRWKTPCDWVHFDDDPRETAPGCCHVVPELHLGEFDTTTIKDVLERLENTGSHAAHGFMKPEGIMVWHTAAQQQFKVTFGTDGRYHNVKGSQK